jgi:hypothetical protein
MHFARSVRRTARRFESQATLHDLEHLARENPEGQKVLIVTNARQSRTVTLQMESLMTNLGCEADSQYAALELGGYLAPNFPLPSTAAR